jgi:integrase
VGCECMACKGVDSVRRLKGKRISSIKRSFNTARKKIGLAHVRFHDLRHTFASWVLQSSQNLKLARDLLGHADLQTTDKYAHLIQAGRAEAVRNAARGFSAELSTNNAQKDRKRKAAKI